MNNNYALFTLKIHNKIKKETGLNEEIILWYDALTYVANKSDGIAKYDDIAEKVLELFEIIGGEDFEYNEENILKINTALPNVLKYFERKRLIDYQMIEDGKLYPRLIGYNYLNDPEFFIAYRKKGATEWDERMSTITDTRTIMQRLLEGCEFERYESIKFLLN